MNRKFGYYIVLGLVIGGVLGMLYGPAIGNTARRWGWGTRRCFHWMVHCRRCSSKPKRKKEDK
jgi:hypothetical protein